MKSRKIRNIKKAIRKYYKKALILGAVFVLTLIGAVIVLNINTSNETEEIPVENLAVIHVEKNGVKTNPMYGYTGNIDKKFFRGTITPLAEDMKIALHFDVLPEDLKEITYEVRSLDGERLIESNKIEGINPGDKDAKVELKIRDLLDDGEYNLWVTVATENKNAWYGTRIIKDFEDTSAKALDFVRDFNAKTFDGDSEKEITSLIETDFSYSNSSLAKVGIKDNVSMVMWGNLAPQIEADPVYAITDSNSTFTTIESYYVISSAAGGTKTYYNVKELYRVRVTEKENYLLDFDREINQVINPQDNFLSDSKLMLGIRNSDVGYKTNAAGTTIAVVQAGALYSYDKSNDRVVSVFSMGEKEYRNHDIDIIKIDESGNIDFMVYGYMRRGFYEGHSGILVCHYDNTNQTIDEEVFIESQMPYEIIKEELGKLAYINGQNKFIITLNGVVYEVDLNTRKHSVLIDKLEENAYVVSGDKGIMAWQPDNKIYEATTLKIMDFETSGQYEVSVSENERIYPIGFMGRDIIYGVADAVEVKTELSGKVIFPMKKIIIENEQEKVKTYEPDDCYIMGARVEDNRLIINRAIKNGTGDFEALPDDSIINNEYADNDSIYVGTKTSKEKKTEHYIAFENKTDNTGKNQITPKITVFEESRSIKGEFFNANIENNYVYAGSRLLDITNSQGQAIKCAYENSGVVISGNKYLWIKGEKLNQKELYGYDISDAGTGSSMEVCLEMVLKREGKNVAVKELLDNGKTPFEILDNYLEGRAVDMTGCPLDCIMNYISKGNPVIALDENRNALLIKQYDFYNITVVNPAKDSQYKISLSDAREKFSAAGNVFISYTE